MRKGLIAVGLVCLVGGGAWLALSSQRHPAPPPRTEARVATPLPARPEVRPGRLTPASRPADEDEHDRPRPPVGKSLVPQFDPFLDQLAEAALAGRLEKEAAENGVKLRGDKVRVVIRPTLGDGDKVREAVRSLGGEVVRAVERGASEPTLVAWVPARSLRTLAENPSVRNLHRPVGIHANEAPERKGVDPTRPVPAPEPPPIREGR